MKEERSFFLKQLLATFIVAGVCVIGYYNIDFSVFKPEQAPPPKQQKIVEYKFGFPLDDFVFESSKIKSNQFLGEILSENGISSRTIAEIEEKAKDVFDVRNIRSGKKYHLVRADTCANSACAFIYEPNPLRFVIYDLRDSVEIEVVENEFDLVVESAAGEINSSLWQAMADQDIHPGVIDLMEDALGSSVSFYHTKKGDRFKAIYERKYINGEPVSLGRLIGAYFENKYGEYYSVYYENDLYAGFYDMEGRPSKKAFLKSPIKGSARISSRYNRRRLHPIKKRRIPHLGTDYAAPYGTPIISVADGVITKRSFTRNNGRYVKIRHDGTYETQYLHMQRFAKGIKPGVQVSQGTIIGYVGSTGLATGPHVCFRFWKNKNQIDHLRENFPPAEPLPETEMQVYFETRDSIRSLLNNVHFSSDTILTEEFKTLPEKSL